MQKIILETSFPANLCYKSNASFHKNSEDLRLDAAAKFFNHFHLKRGLLNNGKRRVNGTNIRTGAFLA